jgi:hypothetical protein
MAATRSDAVLGAVAAFLVAADALMLISLWARDSVMVHPLGRSVPLGVVAAGLALPVAITALLAGPVASPLGFGKSAGLRSAIGGAVLGLVVVLAGAYAI